MFDSVQQSSGCLIKIPSVTAAHVFVYDSALLKGRHDILVDCRKNGFGGVNQPNSVAL